MTFYQKQALADDLRRKWRNDNGYLSMFDRPLVKNVKERAKTAKQKTRESNFPMRRFAVTM